MEENRIVAKIRDRVGGTEQSLRVSRVDQVTVERFLGAFTKRAPHLKGLDLVLVHAGEELLPTQTLASVVEQDGESGELPSVDLEIREKVAESPALRFANDFLGLVEFAPPQFQGKNRRLLERIVREESTFARAGSVLVNWCDQDFATFEEPQREALVAGLVQFVFLARNAPEDASYNAVLAASHVPTRLPWDDDEFSNAFCEVVEALLLYVRGGEGTAYTQRALERLREGVELPGRVRQTVDRVYESLWKPSPQVGGARRPDSYPSPFPKPSRTPGPPPVARTFEADRGRSVSTPSFENDPYGEARRFETRGPRVALLIDLENLVYGIRAQFGDDAVANMVDFESIYVYAAGFGNVCMVNAYADWKYRIMNQFQRDFYNHGAELIHVLGKGRKNAADLRMAVDVTELIFSHPEIETYVIVSGDRDFIEILKQLRRHGKRVVGIANQYSVNRDFARLFDDFRSYFDVWQDYHRSGADYVDGGSTRIPDPRRGGGRPEANDRGRHESDRGSDGQAGAGSSPDSSETDSSERLRGDSGGAGSSDPESGSPPSLAELKTALREVLEEHGNPRGLKGARVKPLLRERLTSRFHERDFGFSSIAALLRSVPEVVTILELEGGGDILVFAADSAPKPDQVEELLEGRRVAAYDPVRELVRQARLSTYRFEPDPTRRRAILARLHSALSVWGSFVWEEVYQSLKDDADDPLSPTLVSKYQAVLYQNFLFTFDVDEDPASGAALKHRRAHLAESIKTLDDFARGYELGIIKKLVERLDRRTELDDVVCLLGSSGSEEDIAYCTGLLREARQAVGGSLGDSEDSGEPTSDEPSSDEPSSEGPSSDETVGGTDGESSPPPMV